MISRRKLIAGVTASLITPAKALSFNGGGIIDPYILSEFNGIANYGNYNLASKTSVAIDLTKNNCVIPVFGQSNHCNVLPSAHTPASSHVYNFCIYNGAMYSDADPLLGCSNGGSPYGPGNILSYLGDSIMGLGKFDNVIFEPCAIGGTSIAQWGVDAFQRIAVSAKRLASKGLTATAILFQQGEADTGAGTSQAAYAASLSAMIVLVNAAFPNIPIFIAISSWNAGATSANVTNAQASVISAPGKIILGPNLDLILAGGRQADNTHFNDASGALIGGTVGSSAWLPKLVGYGPPFA